jgi:energy-coupling factor transport system ATP-binding protein
MSLMEIRGLRHVYSAGTPFEKVAIDDLDLDLEAQKVVGLIGHTGSGKSTLIQHLNALLKPTSGTVLFQGQDIFASKESMRNIRFRVGLVFQYPEYQLFEETVYADIAFGPKNQKLTGEALDTRVREAAEFVGLDESLFQHSPLELSGGQKRRVAIAGVLAMEPELLILDEPSAGLDPAGREDLLQKLYHWREARGATILLVTHDMSAAALCDELVVMSGGHIVLSGTPNQVFAHAETIQALGLELPEAAQIALLLKKQGIALPDSIYTTDQLRDAILALWREKGGAAC